MTKIYLDKENVSVCTHMTQRAFSPFMDVELIFSQTKRMTSVIVA